MRNIRKAAEFLKKAVRALRGKASVLKARLLFLASLRRRTAVVGAISHHIRALMPIQEKAAAGYRGKVLAPAEDLDEQLAPAELHDVAGLSELANLFQEVEEVDGRGGGYPDWTHSLFGDDDDDNAHEPSVIDVIRSRRERDGVEFSIEVEIDHAADMFIRKVRSRWTTGAFS